MLSRFFSYFKWRKDPPPKKDAWEAKLIWLAPDHADNPFQLEVLDCRAVAQTFSSWTGDKSVAEKFTRLRDSDGRDACGSLPEDALEFECSLRFPFNGEHQDGPVRLACEMEDKWDFFAYDNRLYVRRSWTGNLIHVAELEYAPDAVLIRRIYSSRAAVHDDRDFAVHELRFLITTHMGRTLLPFPIPPGWPRMDARAIALTGFSSYGHRAMFGQYVDQGGDESPATRPMAETVTQEHQPGT